MCLLRFEYFIISEQPHISENVNQIMDVLWKSMEIENYMMQACIHVEILLPFQTRFTSPFFFLQAHNDLVSELMENNFTIVESQSEYTSGSSFVPF